MNRIVRRHYPVAKLPADLREGLADGEATVTVEVAEAAPAIGRRDHFSRFFHLNAGTFRDGAEVDAYVAKLRGEWDERG